ncbi:MAG: FtsQ-type POTRA domain-containing protein [Clostridia bacterium]|nr:FtsQ-type POTRA domain-containing protein [Clostridia bacterium]
MSHRKSSPARRIALLLIVAVLIAGLGYFVYEYFQVRSVIPAGNARFTSAYIRAIADIAEGTHMLEVNEERVRSNVQSVEPYLQVTAVRRQLPDTVIIEVEERRPAAFLPYGNQFLLIDINTDILEITESDESVECPLVEGISVTDPQVGSEIVTEDAFKIAIMQEILLDLDSRSLFPLIAVVDLSNINNIRMESRDGLAIRIGQAERIGDKIKWIQNRLPALAREGESDGLLDVSSGSFATYTMYDEDQASRPGPSPSPSPGSSASSPSSGTSALPEPEETGQGTASPEPSETIGNEDDDT